MEKGNKCCFTGYRPNKFSFELESGEKEYIDFENSLFEAISTLAESGINKFYNGMAMGFDIICAETVLELRELRPDLEISLVAVMPFINQSDSFSNYWKQRFDRILSLADKTVLVSDKYYRGCYMARNKYLVDKTDVVLTYFDGKKGGTKNTLEYAKSKNRKIINLLK